MNQLLTATTANNLYWFGRYVERMEAILIELSDLFDRIVDVDNSAGLHFYTRLGIALEYKDARDFINVALFGEHGANLVALAYNARENAIISRSYIDAEAFGTIIELYRLLEHESKNMYSVDFDFVDTIMTRISAIWGSLNHRIKRRNSDYFIRIGKLVEKVDFNLRQGCDNEFVDVILEEIDTMAALLVPSYRRVDTSGMERDALIAEVNAKIERIIAS
ncbi:MAG: alpha-E domain-containing protein [Campylobacterales bacterium]|nr:alpha-E domain-containing protein [Campylobacterales bacterium]